jgi:hypothetical protein
MRLGMARGCEPRGTASSEDAGGMVAIVGRGREVRQCSAACHILWRLAPHLMPALEMGDPWPCSPKVSHQPRASTPALEPA